MVVPDAVGSVGDIDRYANRNEDYIPVGEDGSMAWSENLVIG
jgi:hypothetical protein